MRWHKHRVANISSQPKKGRSPQTSPKFDASPPRDKRIVMYRTELFCKDGHSLNNRSCRDRTFWFPSSRYRDSCSRRSNSCPSDCCWENCGNAPALVCHYYVYIHSRMTGHKRKPGHQREEKHSPRKSRESYKRTNELLSWQSRVFDS